MRPTGILIAMLAGAAALVLAALLDARIAGTGGMVHDAPAPGARAGAMGLEGSATAGALRREGPATPPDGPALAPVDIAPIESAQGLPVRNAEYRLQVGEGEWIAARARPGADGSGDDLTLHRDTAADFDARDTAFVPHAAVEIRAAGHSAQAAQWTDEEPPRTGRRAVIEADALLLLRAPGLGASGAALELDDAWHGHSGRRTLPPGVLLVEPLDEDTIAVAADTDRWKPVLRSRTASGRIQHSPYTSTEVLWRAEPGVHDDVALDVPASWIAPEHARVELREEGLAVERFLARTVRARLHSERDVRRSVETRVELITRLGCEVIEETRVHPHPKIDLPVGLGPFTAAIVREDGSHGAVSFEPAAGRVAVPMVAPSALQGRVVDQYGVAIADARVTLVLATGSDQDWTDGGTTATADDGSFELTAPGRPPLPTVAPGTAIAPPTSAIVSVETPGGARTRELVDLLPGRTTITGDITVQIRPNETVANVTLVVSAAIKPTLGEVRGVAWQTRMARVIGVRWTGDDELVCILEPDTSVSEVPGSAIVATSTGSFAATREDDHLVLGPTYPRALTFEVDAEPGQRLVLLYRWKGALVVAYEPEGPAPEQLDWTGHFPAPSAELLYELRDIESDRVLSRGSLGGAGSLDDALRIGR